ncbi:MAG: helix-turn-helix domain-containing protein [Chitinophagaceae bacterium]
MTTTLAQDFLFQRIKEMLPQHISMVDTVSEILNVSSDSAYRRIRGETPLVLEEAKQLCDHYHLSLDQLLSITSGTINFQNVRINLQTYKFEKYLADLIKQVQHFSSFIEKEIIYLTKDLPIFHNFYYQPLIAFRYFFWMKTLIQHPDFLNRHFDLNCVPPEIEALSRQLTEEYTRIPSTEICNTECINAAITQIEFYKESGYFTSTADIKTIYEALEQTMDHLKNQAEYGCKFMPGENPQLKKNNFKFFYNRVVLGDNTVMVVTDKIKTVFLNYDVLNYMTTRDEAFCDPCYRDLQNLMKRSTLISQTSEKQRNIFFNILHAKIKDRKRNL